MKSIVSISKFKPGQTVQGFYLCVEKHIRHTRTGDLYLDLVLRDQTGQVHGKVWDKVADYNEKFQSGDAVAIKGDVDIFMDRTQLIIKRINKATVQNYARYGFDPALVMPTAKYDPKIMWKEILSIIKSIKNPFLKKLTFQIYQDHKEKLWIHPASILKNHNYRSGLLEYVLSMAKAAKNLAPHYDVDSDLVIAGVLLSNIGKLDEIESSYEANLTTEGNLLGHVVLGRDIIQKAAKKIKKFPKNLLIKIEHIILSHMEKSEWRSLKVPAFREALLVNLIHILDSQMNIMDKVISEDQESGAFSNRHNYFRVPLYKGSDGTK